MLGGMLSHAEPCCAVPCRAEGCPVQACPLSLPRLLPPGISAFRAHPEPVRGQACYRVTGQSGPPCKRGAPCHRHPGRRQSPPLGLKAGPSPASDPHAGRCCPTEPGPGLVPAVRRVSGARPSPLAPFQSLPGAARQRLPTPAKPCVPSRPVPSPPRPPGTLSVPHHGSGRCWAGPGESGLGTGFCDSPEAAAARWPCEAAESGPTAALGGCGVRAERRSPAARTGLRKACQGSGGSAVELCFKRH